MSSLCGFWYSLYLLVDVDLHSSRSLSATGMIRNKIGGNECDCVLLKMRFFNLNVWWWSTGKWYSLDNNTFSREYESDPRSYEHYLSISEKKA